MALIWTRGCRQPLPLSRCYSFFFRPPPDNPCSHLPSSILPNFYSLRFSPVTCYQSQRSFVPFWPFSVDSSSKLNLPKKNEQWNLAVTEAERIVGYPTSFMSLRLLLSDEVSNIALQLRKLIGTKHPLLSTAKTLLYDEKASVQTRGLIVLLLSKTFGAPAQPFESQLHPSCGHDAAPSAATVSGIFASQRTIAELVEVVYTADLIHRGLLDTKDLSSFQVKVAKDIEFANRMAVLAGDFLLANACTGLARLGSTKVVQLIADAIANLMEARFILDGTERKWAEEDEGKEGKKEEETIELTFHNWEQKTYLGVASLLAKACEAAMVVVGHNEDIQSRAREFGKNLAFAQQIKNEVEQFEAEEAKKDLKLLSAPVVLHVSSKGFNFGSDLNSQDGLPNMTATPSINQRTELFHLVRAGPGMQLAKELSLAHKSQALAQLDHVPDNESKVALTNIINSIACVAI